MSRCPDEQATHSAAVTDRWTPALLAHAAGCVVCGDIRLVSAALRTPESASLPVPHADPRVLWMSARHARRIAIEAKVSLMVMTVQVVALVGVLGATLSFVPWRTLHWPVWPVQADGSLWTYGAIGVVALALIAASRWIARDA